MFEKFLEALQPRFSAEERLKTLQKQAWETLSGRGLPQKKQGEFQYLPLHKLYAKRYAHSSTRSAPSKEEVASHLLPECHSAYLVFVDGVFAPELSKPPEKMVLLSLGKALHSYGAFLQARLNATIQKEKDPFALLNLSHAEGGVFAYLPPKICIDKPVQCLHFLTEEGAVASPRLQLFLGKGSALTLVSTHHLRREGWINSVVDLHLEEGARGEQISLLLEEPQVSIFEAFRVVLKQDAQFKGLSLSSGADSHRQSYSITLNGENAEAYLDGAWLLRKELNMHVHVLMDHQAPHTRSKQHFKGVVSERSESSFEGKIFVAQAAQKTEAYQLNNNLILGERAQAFSKPNLEIFADDVKASHGTTIGQLDEAALFYMKTRGISEKEAQHLLVNAFSEEIGAKIPLPSLRAKFGQYLSEFLRGA